MGLGRDAYQLAFQVSPIILVNGIASAIGMLPIIAITEALNFPFGILASGGNISLDNFFASYEPLPGSTLIDQKIGEYPFANQAVAANAVIAQPLTISLLMNIPARAPGGYAIKLATMAALQAALQQHNNLGGTYTIVTPAGFYTNCVMLSLRDASRGGSKQPQNAYEWVFRKPLLTLDQAEQALNALMSKINAGTPFNGPPAWSGLETNLSVPPSLATLSVAPVASGTAGTGIAGAQGAIQAPFAAP